MNLTESEAKTKWCPMVSMVAVENSKGELLVLNNASFNRVSIATPLDERGKSINPIGTFCIASKCMMWQTTDYTANHKEGHCGLAKGEF